MTQNRFLNLYMRALSFQLPFTSVAVLPVYSSLVIFSIKFLCFVIRTSVKKTYVFFVCFSLSMYTITAV